MRRFFVGCYVQVGTQKFDGTLHAILGVFPGLVLVAVIELLDKMLEAVDLSREKNIYIANMVKCRPPKNRDPKPEETDLCMDWLRNQVKLMRPKIIVCLGRIAAAKLIKADIKITKEHGQWFEKNGTLMMAMLHPAALLRDPRKKPEAFDDFLTLQEKIKEICEHTY